MKEAMSSTLTEIVEMIIVMIIMTKMMTVSVIVSRMWVTVIVVMDRSDRTKNQHPVSGCIMYTTSPNTAAKV